MEKKIFKGRRYNEVVKLCIGVSGALGDALYKTVNRDYQDKSVEGFLIRGPTSINN